MMCELKWEATDLGNHRNCYKVFLEACQQAICPLALGKHRAAASPPWKAVKQRGPVG